MNQDDFFKLVFSFLGMITILALVMLVLTGCSQHIDNVEPWTTIIRRLITYDKG